MQAVGFDRRRGAFRSNALDPCFFPKKQTPCLTIAVRRSVTPQFVQVNGVLQASRVSVSACVIGIFDYLETTPAEYEHFGHERNTLKFALTVQSC
jgi:hypothetical protein